MPYSLLGYWRLLHRKASLSSQNSSSNQDLRKLLQNNKNGNLVSDSTHS